jgi:hypothetical protein
METCRSEEEGSGQRRKRAGTLDIGLQQAEGGGIDFDVRDNKDGEDLPALWSRAGEWMINRRKFAKQVTGRAARTLGINGGRVFRDPAIRKQASAACGVCAGRGCWCCGAGPQRHRASAWPAEAKSSSWLSRRARQLEMRPCNQDARARMCEQQKPVRSRVRRPAAIRRLLNAKLRGSHRVDDESRASRPSQLVLVSLLDALYGCI